MRRGPRLPLEQLAPYLLDPPHAGAGGLSRPSSLTDPIDFRAVFGNDNPVEMEVGFGKGLYLLRGAGAARR